MIDERSIIKQYVHICGECAMEYSNREFRTPEFDDWLAELRESLEPVMHITLRRTTDLFDTNPGCACCWGAHGRNEPGRFTLDIMIDGDG
ncbi:MAG: hypothetical protein GC155_06175 [Alphaproteobacteria bacterium]|nr:hypothetical protein [Alphaproteobacteria bacterium]